jgi:hypothetical protein
VAHWAEYGDPGYLSFIEEAQPEVAQLGFYGAHFWSLAHTPHYNGYPAHFPVQGLKECGDWFAEKNQALHRLGVQVVGHFNVEFLVGDPDGPQGPTGFFKFYRDLWDEQELGPKPVEDPVDFLEKNADGTPIVDRNYAIGGMNEHWACLRNPHWQQVLKAWVRRGIQRGVEGFVINYFYRHNCRCEHCQAGFRAYLKERFTPDELRERFGLADVDRHEFDELVCWHDPQETTPLRLEMLRFSQVSNKQVFDEVFVRYGRSLKADLILAQWDHLGNFGQISGDERCLLPPELWGRDEDYLWYSTGGSANFTDLEKRFLGDATLQARYLRGAFDDKPFTLGKYESTRIRAAIAELAANGGAPMGFYTNFTDPEARREIVRYYQFLKRYDSLYHANRPYAEAVLLYPRRQVHQGKVEPVETFRQMGKALLEAHVLFDVLPDDLATPDRLAHYGHVFTTDAPEQGRQGGVALPARSFDRLSRFEAPFTVRVSASRPAKGNELTIHFVNYHREEPPRQANGDPSPGGGIRDEKPLPARDVHAEVVVPTGFYVATIEALSPEQPDPVTLEVRPLDGRIGFTMPEFLVYGVARVHLKPVR